MKRKLIASASALFFIGTLGIGEVFAFKPRTRAQTKALATEAPKRKKMRYSDFISPVKSTLQTKSPHKPRSKKGDWLVIQPVAQPAYSQLASSSQLQPASANRHGG